MTGERPTAEIPTNLFGEPWELGEDDAEANLLVELKQMGGFSLLTLPPPLVGRDERVLATRADERAAKSRPPSNGIDRLFDVVIEGLKQKGRTVSGQALVIGIDLGIARAAGVKIWTPPNDLAKELRCRYADLLLVRKLASEEAKRSGLAERYRPPTESGNAYLEYGPDELSEI